MGCRLQAYPAALADDQRLGVADLVSADDASLDRDHGEGRCGAVAELLDRGIGRLDAVQYRVAHQHRAFPRDGERLDQGVDGRLRRPLARRQAAGPVSDDQHRGLGPVRDDGNGVLVFSRLVGRPAREGDKLATGDDAGTEVRGFCALQDHGRVTHGAPAPGTRHRSSRIRWQCPTCRPCSCVGCRAASRACAPSSCTRGSSA